MRPTTITIFSATPVFLVAAVLVIAGVVAGCRNSPPEPTRIGLLDVSGSTVEAQDDYLDHFATATREFARQKGTLHVIVAAGDPLAESKIRSRTFSTEEEGDFAIVDLDRQANDVIGQVDELRKNPGVEDLDTALIRAFVLAAGSEAGRTEGPLDIVVYSDGIEFSEDLDMFNDPLDDAAITTHLDRLEADKLIPKLSGVPVRFVHPGFQHKGPEVDMIQVESFWRAWGERSGATVTWR